MSRRFVCISELMVELSPVAKLGLAFRQRSEADPNRPASTASQFARHPDLKQANGA